MALDTKSSSTCPKCTRSPVTLYNVKGRWMCGKCMKK